MLWEPAQRAVDACVESDGVSRELAHDAMQWRIGNFYYSMLREQWVHAYLRRRGVPVLQHPLADTLFATDGWFGDRAVSLFVSNAEYLSSTSGRKPSARGCLAGSVPPFAFTDMVLPPAKRFGRVHLPSRAALDRYIDSLSTAQ